MNQIQFETSKVYGVFVMLPEDVKSVKVIKYPVSGYWLMDTDSKDFNAWKIHVSNKPIELQGFVSNLTDEQKEGVVDKSKFYNIYLDYVKGAYVEHLSLQKSFASLLTSLNVLLVNPYGDYSVAHKRHIVNGNWQTAQQHVGNWILLTCNK